MKSTAEWLAPGLAEMALQDSLEKELATLWAHLNAATARLPELTLEFRRQGGGGWGDFACWLAFRCGITVREARELVRVADALEELPAMRGAFQRGELTLTKVRALTRVATPSSEAGLLELAGALTASQLERALRAYHRVSSEQAGDTHQLEYVDYYWAEDGSLILLCHQHHRLVHEGSYTIENHTGELRFRNRHGLLHPSIPGRPPPGNPEALIADNEARALRIDANTYRSGYGDPMDIRNAVDALKSIAS